MFDSILPYVNELSNSIASFVESLEYNVSSSLFVSLISFSLNLLMALGFCSVVVLPFIIIFYAIKFISGVL